MKIRTIRATRFSLPFARAVALSTGVRESAEHVLVSVTTEDGATGYAECIPRSGIYGETVEAAPVVIEQVLAPLVVGRSVFDTRAIHTQLAKVVANPSARSAVELAAYDALSRTLEVPAHRLLGGFASEVRCCPVLGYGAPAAVVDEAQAVAERYGVDTFKFKIGPDLRQDIAVAAALRAALGDSVRLYADANGRYSAAEATAFADATGDLRLRWLEEPTAASDLLGRKRVAELSPTPVLGDESCCDPRSAALEVLAGRSSAVSIKIARTGIVASSQVRDFCRSIGASVVIGTQGDSAIGAFTAAAFAAADPSTCAEAAEIMFFLDLAATLTTERPQISNGRLVLGAKSGFGFEIDPDQLAKHQSA
jgi:L-alanine-DL-glutamate epimerase-like enolase superfamily enzyme